MSPDMNEIYMKDVDDNVFLSAVQRRRNEAEAHETKVLKLKSIRAENNRQYLGTYIEDQIVDERYQEIYIDNRQFTSVRTIVPFLTARVTAPEVTPANGTDLSVQFASDFEEVLQRLVEDEMGKAKIRLAVQDLLRGERVGVLKWRYDGKKLRLERIDPKSILIGKRAKLFEEPDYICHYQEKTVGDLLKMFPDKADKIKKIFGITKAVPSQLEKVYDIREEWLWIDVGEEKKLVVGWSWQDSIFGKVNDPNWNEKGNNLIEEQMMPFVFINFLNDGSSYYDQTSFIEQAKWLQRNYNKRGQTIAENAKYGGTGVPIFAKNAITQKDVAKIRFSPIQRVLLDSADVSKAFTVWQSTPLPQYIVEDKFDDRNSIDNIWGTPNVFRGEQSDNNTLGQDVIVRDQAEGRLSDPVDCIDDSMTRLYKIGAQMIYRYFDEEQFFNYIGDDGKFVSIAVSQKDVAKNIGLKISVKAGTSLPIDRAQKRATVMKLLELNKISTLEAYKELGIFDNPESAYKQFVMEQLDPLTSLQEVDKQVFSREASQDLWTVIGGKVPEEREDIEPDYLNYLNEWLLTDKYRLLQLKKPEAAARLSVFIDSIIAKADRKAAKLAMQPAPDAGGAPGGAPAGVPPEVAAMVAAQKGGAPQPGAPGQAPMPPANAPLAPPPTTAPAPPVL